MKYLITFSLLLFFQFSFSQTSIQGTVTDAETGEPIIFGTVALYKNGSLLTGTETDLDGFYSINEIEEGIYDVEFSYTVYAIKKVTGILIIKGKTNQLNVKIYAHEERIHACGFSCGERSIYRQGNLTQGFSFSAEEIRRLPHRN